MLVKCIEAPESLVYDIFMAVSNNRWTYYDLEHAREVLGYRPLDSSEAALASR
jgi:uronate dehydrogenase/NAD+ dependent glucose-6-phosphate dehydrogenase